MSIITIATSKGGAGKTTLAQVLLGTLTGEGRGVSAIDADYNQSLAKWIKTFAMSSIIVRSVIDEGKMIPTTQELEANHELVVIDTAGTPQPSSPSAVNPGNRLRHRLCGYSSHPVSAFLSRHHRGHQDQ